MTSPGEVVPVASDLELPHTAEWIEWYDHVGFTEAYWRTEDQAKELTPAVVVSLGFVIEDRPDEIGRAHV